MSSRRLRQAIIVHLAVVLPQLNSHTLRRLTGECPTPTEERGSGVGLAATGAQFLCPKSVFFFQIRVHLFETGGRVFHRYLKHAVPGACEVVEKRQHSLAVT